MLLVTSGMTRAETTISTPYAGVTRYDVVGTIGANGGSKLTLLGDLTTTGASATTINAPLGESTSFTKKGSQTLNLGPGSRISMVMVGQVLKR